MDIASKDRLRGLLDRAAAEMDSRARQAADPLQFPARYRDPADQEVAAVVASVFAFGRVAAFLPIVARVLDLADDHGGPRRFVEKVAVAPMIAAPLSNLVYRWMNGADTQLLLMGLGRLLTGRHRLSAVFLDGPQRGDAIRHGVTALRHAVCGAADVADVAQLSRGVRYMLPHPDAGSACKRWCMFLRWMVRKPGPGVGGLDLGLWDLDPARLVVPLDTHVHRIGRFLGLTSRADGSWRTAVALTDALCLLDPADPLRFDFVLAHLGISGACQGRFVGDVCGRCPLYSACVEVRHPSVRTG